MTTISISTANAKQEFSELISRVSHGKERIILTRRGQEIAVIVPMEDLLLLQHSQNKTDLQDAVDALKEARSSGTITLDVLKDEIG